MIEIDGSRGEGGGQIIRSSLALALATAQPITIGRIRAGRKRPGLLRQHLTGVRAACEISHGVAEGDVLGSTRLEFHPGETFAGSFTFRIGSAGSTTLVFQTVLPALMLVDAPSQVILEGGTHNAWAPPYDFLKEAFFPCLATMGVRVDSELERHGFFPAGRGRWRARIDPVATLRPLVLEKTTPVGEPSVRALVARLPEDIGRRECDTIVRKLDWTPQVASVETVRDSAGPGNVVMVRIPRGDVVELFTGFGIRGVPAEKVANELAREIQRYLAADVSVGEHLADQLLLPMALAASRSESVSRMRTLSLSSHATTQIELIRQFLDVRIDVEPVGEDVVVVEIGPGRSQARS